MKKNIKINDKIGVMTVVSINPFVVQIGGKNYNAEIRGEKKESLFKIDYNFFIDAYNDGDKVTSVELPKDYAVYGIEQCTALLNTNLAGDSSKLESIRIYYPGPEEMKINYVKLRDDMARYDNTLYYHSDGQSAELLLKTSIGITAGTIHTFILS